MTGKLSELSELHLAGELSHFHEMHPKLERCNAGAATLLANRKRIESIRWEMIRRLVG